MGPNRSLRLCRGYLTQTVFDPERGVFEDAPFPPQEAAPAPPPAPAALPCLPAGAMQPA